MVAKVTTDTNRWKVVTETSIDTDNGHVSSNLISNRLAHVIFYSVLLFWSCCVECIEEEEMVGRQLNRFEELEPSA